MSKVKNESDLSGVFGERVTFRKVSGRVEAQNRAKKKRTNLTAGQQAVISKFQSAVNYAKAQLNDPIRLGEYSFGITPKLKSAYVVALNDFLSPPEVLEIKTTDYKGVAGDKIAVMAKDDFKVTRVKVTLTNEAGSSLEEGDAIQDPLTPENWMYTTTVANPTLAGTRIVAKAFDQPKHEGSLERVL